MVICQLINSSIYLAVYIAMCLHICMYVCTCICTYIFPVSSSVIDVTATLDTPNENRILHSITVNCTIHSDSTADMCEVMATANGHNLTGT